MPVDAARACGTWRVVLVASRGIFTLKDERYRLIGRREGLWTGRPQADKHRASDGRKRSFKAIRAPSNRC